MLNREIVLTGIYPETATRKPAAREARVESERAIEQPDHGADIFAEITKHESGVDENVRVVFAGIERLPRQIHARASGSLRRFGPAPSRKVDVADRRPGQSQPVMPIDCDRL